MIEYNLPRFREYNTSVKKKVICESTVLGAPVLTKRGQLQGIRTGVDITNLADHGTDDEVARASKWLSFYAGRIRDMAASAGGVSALVVPHPDGVEVINFGVKQAFFAHDPDPPITQVVLLVAGPAGFGSPSSLRRLEAALMKGRTGHKGLHVGPLHLSVPSVNRSYAALGDLFMCHDREILIPIIEDLRHVGVKEYTEWMHALQGAMNVISMAFSHTEIEHHESKTPMRQRLTLYDQKVGLVLRAQAGLQRLAGHADDPKKEDNQKKEDARHVPLAAVKERIKLLENTKSLPECGIKRKWRARMWCEASEPAAVMEVLLKVAESDIALEDRWEHFADLLEEEAVRQPPQCMHTPRAVKLAVQDAINKCRPPSSRDRSESKVSSSSVPEPLWRLTCKDAVHVAEQLGQQAAYVRNPIAWLKAQARKRLGEEASESEEASEDEAVETMSFLPKPPAAPPPSNILGREEPRPAGAFKRRRNSPNSRPPNSRPTLGVQLRRRAASPIRGKRSPHAKRKVTLQPRRLGRRGDDAGADGRSRRPPNAFELQDFVKRNNLDADAFNALRGAPADVQEELLRCWSCGDSKSPSHAFTVDLRNRLARMHRDSGAGDASARHQGRTGQTSKEWEPLLSDQSRSEKIQLLVEWSDIDARAAKLLKDASPDVQNHVLSFEELYHCSVRNSGVRNQSALLASRIELASRADKGDCHCLLCRPDKRGHRGDQMKSGAPVGSAPRTPPRDSRVKRASDEHRDKPTLQSRIRVDDEVGQQAPRTPPMDTRRVSAKPKAMPRGTKRVRFASASTEEGSIGRDAGTSHLPPPAPQPLAPLHSRSLPAQSGAGSSPRRGGDGGDFHSVWG